MTVQIQPIQSHQIAEAKRVIAEVNLEIGQLPLTLDELLSGYEEEGVLDDIEDVQAHYGANGGLFLVLVDEGRVVGMGGIRRLADDICELKRMWFLREYRGQGLGREMAERLLDFARQQGYTRVRLDMVNKEMQAQALRLYERLGFYFIERYQESSCGVFMEKVL